MENSNAKEMTEKITNGVDIDSSFSLISTITSIIGMLLATIALGGIRMYWVAALALLVVGIAQFFEGVTLNSRVSALGSRTAGRPFSDIGANMMTGRLAGGVLAILLGLLSLLAVAPRILLPVGGIILGVVLILGAFTIPHLNGVYTMRACDREEMRAVARAAVKIAVTLEAFIGCGGIALGAIALTGFGLVPVSLTLVTLFGVGFSSLLNSTLFSGRVLGSLHCEKAPVV